MKRILTVLLAANCLTPIALLLILGLERLLAALGDDAGAAVLGRLALAGGAIWTMTLVTMLLALAFAAIGPLDDRD